MSQKIQKTSDFPLTLEPSADYIRLNNEGGAPLATKEFALEVENQESRVSDTQSGPKPVMPRAPTLRLQCLFFEN
ncbi:hypothetical protein [Nitratireductor soli]|uniref:hypothetical protein n=1 Tax=Nitratireductor soli TaxID=1670619 RepID=UPI0019CFB432|nr:hypothetical protein [Nitratireductor soli]